MDSDQVIVGVFDAAGDARRAIEDLRAAGFTDRKIGVLTRGSDGEAALKSFRELEGNKAATGAAVGVATGAGGGALWALGVAAGVLPAIGPVIAGGTLLALAASAAAGAAAGAVVGTLVGLGVPDAEAAFYEEELRQGRTILVVNHEQRGHLAQSILQASNARAPRTVVRESFAQQIDRA